MSRQVKKIILSINCGSAHLKFKLFHSVSLKLELEGSIDHIGNENSRFQVNDHNGRLLVNDSKQLRDLDSAIGKLICWLQLHSFDYPLVAIGYRLIQGGPGHRSPEIVTPELISILKEQIYLAPNHLPDELKVVEALANAFKEIVHVACYDTLFHRNMPLRAKHYPLPAEYIDKGLIKYGSHGLSYEYIMKKLGSKISAFKRRRIIIAHLGNGASMVAVKNGIGIDTTMGISPMGGLVMGTRSGDLDPGAILFLLKECHLTPDEIDDLLCKESGLKALGGTNDVQELIRDESKNPKAALALSIFCYTIKKYIGAFAVAMGGLDMVIFTGGIGENSPIIRARICDDMDFLGIMLHEQSNETSHEIISPVFNRVQVRVIPTNEEWMIAHHTRNYIY